MARFQVNDAVLTTAGSGGRQVVLAVPNATITVVLAGTSTAATVYQDESSGSVYSGGIVTASAQGEYNFWLDEANDYDLVVTASGFGSETIRVTSPTAGGTTDSNAVHLTGSETVTGLKT